MCGAAGSCILNKERFRSFYFPNKIPRSLIVCDQGIQNGKIVLFLLDQEIQEVKQRTDPFFV